MENNSKSTTNSAFIIKWAEQRGGKPAKVKNTGNQEDPEMIRIDFGEEDEGLEEISWEKFIDAFTQRNPAFLYQRKTSKGELSRFNKLVSKESVE